MEESNPAQRQLGMNAVHEEVKEYISSSEHLLSASESGQDFSEQEIELIHLYTELILQNLMGGSQKQLP